MCSHAVRKPQIDLLKPKQAIQILFYSISFSILNRTATKFRSIWTATKFACISFGVHFIDSSEPKKNTHTHNRSDVGTFHTKWTRSIEINFSAWLPVTRCTVILFIGSCYVRCRNNWNILYRFFIFCAPIHSIHFPSITFCYARCTLHISMT